jgi:arylsulfatase A-like enzyme
MTEATMHGQAQRWLWGSLGVGLALLGAAVGWRIARPPADDLLAQAADVRTAVHLRLCERLAEAVVFPRGAAVACKRVALGGAARPALVTPAGTEVVFPGLRLDANAVLRLAIGIPREVATAPPDGVEFRVAVRRAGAGRDRVVARRYLRSRDASREWMELPLRLGDVGGTPVDLVLATHARGAGTTSAAWATPQVTARGRLRVGDRRLGGVARPALLPEPGAAIRFRRVTLRPGAVLRFGIGVEPVDGTPPGDGVLFQVHLESDRHRIPIYSRHLDPRRGAPEQGWVDAAVALDPVLPRAGATRTDLVFTVGPGPHSTQPIDRGFWARPTLTVEPSGAARREPRPHVVLISIDTLRADHLSTYGYARATSPRIDAWSRTAAVFEDALSPANHTLLSHMSLLTALYPDVHNVWSADGTYHRVGARHRLLAEHLRGAGYETAAIVNSGWLGAKFGFDDGFDVFHVVDRVDAAALNARYVFPWLARPRTQPFFLFVHYYDVHADFRRLPYEAPPTYDRRFVGDYYGSYDGCIDGRCANEALRLIAARGLPLAAADLAYVTALYDGGIAFTDEQIGRLIEHLRTLGLYDRTVVVLTADHGEEFREHGHFLHRGLYQEVIHVPLIISYPPMVRAQRIAGPVSTLSIGPTILDLVGLPANPGAQAPSLLGVLRGVPPAGTGTQFSDDHQRGRRYALRAGDWKLIWEPEPPRRELYHLGRDPAERDDRAAAEPARAAAMEAQLRAWRRDNDARRDAVATREATASTVQLAPAERERLRQLGYEE